MEMNNFPKYREYETAIWCSMCWFLRSLHYRSFGDTLCGRWPKTLAGILTFLPCAPALHPSGSALRSSSQRVKKAWRRCDRAGRWAEEDYTQCPYASELTRVLHELTKVFAYMENFIHWFYPTWLFHWQWVSFNLAAFHYCWICWWISA